jgi:SagB-type dehydrogenase family enzyme
MAQHSQQQPTATLDEFEAQVKPSYEYASYDIDCLHEVFNENAKYYRATMTGLGMRISDFLNNPSTIKLHLSGVKNYDSFPALALAPPRAAPPGSLADALAQRRSLPQFGQPMTAAELSDLLHGALASNHTLQPAYAPDQVMHRKPYPSGGGLYPVEFYVAILDVAGIAPCLAHYDGIRGDLRVVRDTLSLADINGVMTTPFQPGEAPSVVIFMSGVFQRSTNKYGSKGYKFAMIEVGAAGQTLQLVSTALRLNSLFWSSFFDDEVERLLGIDGVSESVITAFMVGKARGQ